MLKDRPRTANADHRVWAEPLAIDVEAAGDRIHIRLTGELDVATARKLKADMPAASTDAVIDLENLAFMDCAGFTALTEVSDDIRRCGTAVQWINPRGQVQRLLNLLKANSARGTGAFVAA